MSSFTAVSSEYLSDLLSDKTTVAKMPKIFIHAERLLDQEINRVRNELFHGSTNGALDHTDENELPPAQGPKVKVAEKVYAPVKAYPKFNFVGRIIGPRGMTLKCVETTYGCKLLVRGRGSMKDKKQEEEKRGQPNYEHLEEALHVLITVEDTEERAKIKLAKAVEKVNDLLRPVEEGEDELKKTQLKELALLNGTLREPGGNSAAAFSMHAGLLGMPLPPALAGYHFARPPVAAGYHQHLAAALDFPYAAAGRPAVLDYALAEPSILGAVKPRRPVREHPYQR